MKATLLACVVTGLFCYAAAPVKETEPELSEQLQFLKPLIGKTLRGEFANSTPDRPLVDISKWERALNGRAVRIMHSLNDGEYGGESILMWDEKAQKLTYWYFTTAGFYTHGTMEVDGNSLTTIEKVTGNGNGITEVRTQQKITSEGGLIVKAEYLKDGKWTLGREVTYRESPDSVVKFK